MNDSAAIHSRTPLKRVGHFFRNPKTLLIVVLGGFVAIAAPGNGITVVAHGLVAAVAVAMLLDAPILRLRKKKWLFPNGALLTGLIVAMLLSPQTPWRVVAFASAAGVASKYVIRARTANIFNPAALALLAATQMFHSGQSWWGALSDLRPAALEPVALAVLIAAGSVVADRVHRLPAAITFLGVYFLLFTLHSFFGDPARFAAIYRASDLHAVLFFAFFMVTDPPTSPSRDRDQVVFGVITAVCNYVVFVSVGAVYYLVAGILVANAWEAWRRRRVHAARQAG